MNPVLTTTKEVIKHASFVKIDQTRVLEFAKNFDHGKVSHWLNAAPIDFSRFNETEKLHFLFLFNSLSFSYWGGEPKWTIEFDGEKFDGSWGLVKALDEGIRNGFDLLNFEYCSKISRDNFAEILSGNVEIPLFEERWNILRELGCVMMEKFDGRADNLLQEADGDAIKLLTLILENFPSFRDVSIYKGQEIYFQKRVQLLTADIYQMFDGQGFGALRNTETITACADYKLPQILRKLGILIYTDSLANKIDNKIELPHGSEEEIEIRASTIWAVELIRQAVAKRQPEIKSFEINDHLWLATQEKFPDDKPYHRTRTTAY